MQGFQSELAHFYIATLGLNADIAGGKRAARELVHNLAVDGQA